VDGETKDEQKKTGVAITDNKAKKQWLQKYQAATREIEDLIRERAVWRERGETITQVISEMPHGGGASDKTGEAAARIAAIDEQILQRIGELAKFRSDIECVIAGTGDDTLRRLLRLRYVKGLKWDAIAAIMNYSYRRVLSLHGIALGKIEIPTTTGAA